MALLHECQRKEAVYDGYRRRRASAVNQGMLDAKAIAEGKREDRCPHLEPDAGKARTSGSAVGGWETTPVGRPAVRPVPTTSKGSYKPCRKHAMTPRRLPTRPHVRF